MSSEIDVLLLYGLLTIVVLLVHVLMATAQLGLPYLATPRDEARELTGVPARALRCLNNSVVAMALFAPPVLVLFVKDASTGATLLAAQAFLLLRIVYVVIYLAGIPWLRTLVWVSALLCTAFITLAAL